MVDKKLALVIGVYSADHFLLQMPSKPGMPTKHLEFKLASIRAPKMGSNTHKEETLAFLAREWVRAKLIAKKVTYTSVAKVKDTEYGHIYLDAADISSELLKNGYAKVIAKSNDYPSSPLINELYKIEAAAKSEELNIWSKTPESIKGAARDVKYSNDSTFDYDRSFSLLNGKQLPGIIEYVFSGTSLNVYVESQQMMIKVFMQGVSSPSFEKEKSLSEEAKEFTERMLLHRNIIVVISSVEENKKGFIGEIKHKEGDIANELLLRGYAKVFKTKSEGDQFINYFKSMQVAQSKRLGVWKNFTSEVTNMPKETKVNKGVIMEIHSGDSLTILCNGEEHRVFLVGIKAPSFSFRGKCLNYGWESREYLRKLCIGKAVEYEIEYQKEVKKEEKAAFQMSFANVVVKPENINLSVEMVSQGYASVAPPRATEVIPKSYEQIVKAEVQAKSKKLGVHSGVEVPLHNFKDLCGVKNSKEAKSYQEFFRNKPRISGTVECCFSGCRIKLGANEQSCYMSFCCMGTKTIMGDEKIPETIKANNDSLAYSKKRLLNRDVEAEILYCDKNGVYYGDLFYNKEHFNSTLIQNGHAYVFCPSNKIYKYKDALTAEEQKAKAHAVGIWGSDVCKQIVYKKQNVSYEVVNVSIEGEVTEVVDSSRIYIQTKAQKKELENVTKLISTIDFSKLPSIEEANIKTKLTCLCQFSADNQWYRAKIIYKPPKDSKKVLVMFMDFGSTEFVNVSSIKPTNEALSKIPQLCTQISLAFLITPEEGHSLYNSLTGVLQKMLIGKTVIAKVAYRDSECSYSIIMKEGKMTVEASFNNYLLENGFAKLSKAIALPEEYNSLVKAMEKAKKEETGIWETGHELFSDADE